MENATAQMPHMGRNQYIKDHEPLFTESKWPTNLSLITLQHRNEIFPAYRHEALRVDFQEKSSDLNVSDDTQAGSAGSLF